MIPCSSERTGCGSGRSKLSRSGQSPDQTVQDRPIPKGDRPVSWENVRGSLPSVCTAAVPCSEGKEGRPTLHVCKWAATDQAAVRNQSERGPAGGRPG